MNIRYYLIILFTLSITACEKSVDLPTTENYPIALVADVVSVNASRANEDDDYFIYKGTSAHDMTADVWFSTTKGKYPKNDAPQAPTFLPYHAKVTYDGGTPTTVYVNPDNRVNPLSYPLPDDTGNKLDVYCVGLYPSGEWNFHKNDNINNESTATHTITGKADIMFAEQLKGSWGEPFTTQTYQHLLTWLKFEIRATDVEAIEQWGNIKKISVMDVRDKVVITFPTNTAVDNENSKLEYIDSDNKENEIKVKEDNTPLTVTAQDFGSVLCAPSATIKLAIETEKKGTRTIENIKLYDEQGAEITTTNYIKKTTGRLFIINLYFNKFNDIDASCSLIPWNEQDVNINGN